MIIPAPELLFIQLTLGSIFYSWFISRKNTILLLFRSEAVAQRCSVKKDVLHITQDWY